jgi:hypothetical protein
MRPTGDVSVRSQCNEDMGSQPHAQRAGMAGVVPYIDEASR